MRKKARIVKLLCAQKKTAGVVPAAQREVR
jgi:hypothetical protein